MFRQEFISDTSNIKVGALENDLRGLVEGEVRFDAGSRALYATDGSNYRQVPIGVVIPRHVEDVVQTVAICRKHGAPVLSRGCGTSLAGQCCNVAVVLDMSKYMNRIIELDPQAKTARVQPGVILDQLRQEAEKHNLTFAPDPATHNHNTLGGMIGNNSCGIHSVMGGRTVDNIIELDVLTYDGERLKLGATAEDELEQIIAAGGRRGEIYAKLKDLRDRYAALIRERYPRIPRRVSGFSLDELLPENGFQVARSVVGSEGTCVIVLEATVRLIYSSPARSLVVLGYPDVYTAGDHIPEIMKHSPTGCEGVDDRLIDDMKRAKVHPQDVQLLPDGGGWLLVEMGGEDKQDADDKARALMEALKKQPNPPHMKLYDDKADEEKIWEVRESGLGSTAHVPGKKITWPGWEDSAVPPDKVGAYLRDLRQLFDKYGYQCDLYGHFGQGCIHVRIDFDLESEAGLRKYRAFVEEAADVVVGYGGSFSGEHGDGQSRGELLSRMFGEELVNAFREFKAIWDPLWKMNPGKVVEPYRLDENLRLGADYRPWEPATVFSYHEDEEKFSRAVLRCVGVGKCRRLGGGTMCPSFMATREEKHSTRGRAHLLFEMLKGDVIRDGWKSEAVKEALDLCLACKGCKHDCPVNVDMATYKAEFMSHYYDSHRRPLHDYLFGYLDVWSRYASKTPGFANFVSQNGILSRLGKAAFGIAHERRLPEYAKETFQQWFRKRGLRNPGQRQVMLWPDTFNNYFFPQTARAAVEVLESAGYQVLVPDQPVCCGRPLYDPGLLDRAQRLLRRNMTLLKRQIDLGTPLVGLEPACTSVFRDELISLFPRNPEAQRLSRQTYLLSEFLHDKANYRPPQLARKAIVHGHCNHKAIMSMDAEKDILQKMGLDFEILKSGCCGMAGSFGFIKDKYDVSIKAGERVLLPAVRQADGDTLVITDGYSCREQIAQTTGRQAVHLADVLQMALHER